MIQQGGSRRGALMLMLDDDHPDVEEFVTVKRDLSKLNGANLSVCVSDRFMDAVEADADWPLRWEGEVQKTLPARRPVGPDLRERLASGRAGPGLPGALQQALQHRLLREPDQRKPVRLSRGCRPGACATWGR